jgi:hypothetical protein
MADGLAKQGFEHPFIGPEQCCSISMLVAKKSARDWKVQRPQEILGPSANKARELLKLNRNQLRWVVGLLTGYSQARRVYRKRRLDHTHPV